jgi:hypothetical protein
MAETVSMQPSDCAFREALTEAVTAVFDRWGLNTAQQAGLLGLPRNPGLRRGEPLPQISEVMERAGTLISVHRALQRRYAHRDWLGDRWISTPQPQVGGRLPLDTMIEGGLGAINEVRAIVEREIG